MNIDDIYVSGMDFALNQAAIYAENSGDIHITNTTMVNTPGQYPVKSYGNNCFDFTGSHIDASYQKNAIHMSGGSNPCTVILDNTIVTNAMESNIHLMDGNKSLHISNSSEISNAGGDGIFTIGDNSGATIEYSKISNNGNHGIHCNTNSPIDIAYSVIDNNHEKGINTDSDVDINHSVFVNNGGYGIDVDNGRFTYVNNSIFWGNGFDGNSNRQIESDYGQLSYSIIQGVEGYGTNGNLDFLDCSLLNPLLNSDYSLGEFSSAIDAGAPYSHDLLMPPGLGTVRSDAGIFGGLGNSYWGGNAIPDGSPIIDNVYDLPQDQGGWVGIQYSGSIFDHSHSGYDITRYSFWRLMDADERLDFNASDTPTAQYFNMGRDEYWEHVGEMTAQGFESYGFSAPTLGNSIDEQEFISTFLVVAHTVDDDVFFVSEQASGSSIDNLAPPEVANLTSTMDGASLILSWDESNEDDFLYYSIYRNECIDNECYALLDNTNNPQYIDDSMPYGSTVDYKVSATDENSNESDFTYLSTYVNVVGDVNQDYSLNVLDLISIVGFILGSSEFDDTQQVIADVDLNGTIDILDLVTLIGAIVEDNSRIADILDTNAL